MLRKPSEIIIDGMSLEEILNKHEKQLLFNTDLSNADLSNSDLRNADLSCTNLSNADLSNLDLRNADLSCTNLSNADLSYTDLSCTNLSYANLKDTCLRYADLSYADLNHTNLLCTDLRGATLRNANFRDATLSEVKYNHETAFFTIQCPEEGSFVGYKKADGKIVKLLILEDSKRSSATTRKCRCDKAKVLSIESLDGKEKFTEVKSDYYSDFVYKVGEIVKVDNFCEDRWKECAPGIHFFITKQEAINY